jgi:hypothetical protein
MAQDEDVDVTKEDIEANTDDTPTDDNGDAKE